VDIIGLIKRGRFEEKLEGRRELTKDDLVEDHLSSFQKKE
jgi:hypothetical protein